MLFGCCCFLENDRFENINMKSIKIDGVQRGLLVNFEIIQTFYHSEKESKKVSYIFPNDLKICIYDTTFVVGEEIIKPKLQSKEEAEKTFKEAVDKGHTAVLGTNIGRGMTRFELGNIPPNIECKVILKIAFTGQVTKEKTFYIKFPIEIYSPSGPAGCLNVNNSTFSFQLQCESEKVTKVTSNVKNSKFDEALKIFSIQEKIEHNQNEKSIIITFETAESIESSCLISPTDSVNYDGCAITISPNLPPSEVTNNEFVFLVDCSGSMNGSSIKKAAECLEFFIKSLPSESYFNVIRFGSRHEKLFDHSVLYDDQTSEKAIDLAQKLNANLGGTNILSPLEGVFEEKCQHNQRQIFIMTDGEVFNAEEVIELISSNSNENRCFTIGIGRGCDAGLVEGMASVSGGKSDFVQEGDSISDKVIPQLQSSLHPSVTSLEIHIEGEDKDSFEVYPYPIPSVNSNGSNVVYLRQKKSNNSSELIENGILITANYGNEQIEIPITDIVRLSNVEEDKFGCSGGKNLGKAILPLFAFSILQKLDRKRKISDSDKMKAIELSISSGVLCKYTGFVGLTENQVVRPHLCEDCCQCCCCRCSAPEMMKCCRAAPPKVASPMRPMAAPPPPQRNQAPQDIDIRQIVIDHSRCAGINAAHAYRKKKEKIEKPAKYELINLTRCQKAAGFWEDLETVKSLAGVNVDKIDNVDLSDKNMERKCVATIIAIATMRVKSSNEKNSWIMIEQKALAWLKKNLPDADIEQVISKVQSLIK